MSQSTLFSLEDLTVGFERTPSLALKRINVRFCAGDFIVLTGSNGSGKSTFLGVLSGRVITRSGKLLLPQGKRFEPRLLPRLFRVSTVHQRQEDGIIPGISIIDHLVFRSSHDRRREQVKKEAYSFLCSFSLFKDLADRQDELASNLSGGWQQLLQVAACVFAKPDILLLDEPNSNLSEAKQEALDAFLAKHALAPVVIYVSHRAPSLPILQRVNRRWIIAEGELVSCMLSAQE